MRALAVLVVATPCPLILAVPIAFVGGVSRAARRGIVVKGGTALEQLGRARTVVFDKTGTLTAGTPAVEDIQALDGVDGRGVLRLAAAVDQMSPHVLAQALVMAARRANLRCPRRTGSRRARARAWPAASTATRSSSARRRGCTNAEWHRRPSRRRPGCRPGGRDARASWSGSTAARRG